MNEETLMKKYQVIILKKMIRDYKRIVKSIEKNNANIVNNHLSDVGTQRYWKRHEKHDALSKELEVIKTELKFMFDYCNILNMLHQERYKFIEDDIIKMIKGE